MIKRRRDDLTLHLTGLVHARALFEARGATLRTRSTIDYGAAKAALLNVAKALSKELGPRNIRINSVSLGPVATDLWLGDHGVAATISAATGVDPRSVRPNALEPHDAVHPPAFDGRLALQHESELDEELSRGWAHPPP